MGESRGSIAFFATYRPPLPLNLFSCPATDYKEQSLPEDEQALTDAESYNYNGHVVPPAALKTILRHTKLASLVKEADVNINSGLIFVSERDSNLETLHLSLRFNNRPSEVKVFSLAEVFGTESFNGIRMEDSGCIAGDHSLIYMSTKEPVQVRRSPWTVIYKTDLRTSKTERLTPQGKFDLSPSVSPSGKKVAVASFEGRDKGKGRWTGEIEDLQTNIYVMNVETTQMGLERKILIENGGWPSWGSENVIFFHRKVGDFWGVFQFNIKTEQTTRVTPDNISAVTPAAIGETKVAVSIIPDMVKNLVGKGLTQQRSDEQYRHIVIFDANSPGRSVEITKPRADYYNPFVIDGGKRIGYHRCNVSLLQNTDEVPRNFHNLPSPLENVGLFRMSGAFPTISNDGKKLAFVDNEFKAVWLADKDGLRVVLEEEEGNSFFSPMWNQNNAKDTLYVCVGPSFSAVKPLDIIAIPNVSKGGFNRRQLTKKIPNVKINNAFPSSNPQGNRLVFRSTRDGLHGDPPYKSLYIMENADVGEYGGKITRLTTKENCVDTHCQWSPSGDWIVFSSTRDKPTGKDIYGRDIPDTDNGLDAGYYAVFLVNANYPNTVVRVLASGDDIAGHVNHPVFSLDGRSIVVTADLAAVSVDPMSLPLFLHSVRPYGDIFTVDIDTKDINKNKDVKKFCRITHSRYENSTPTWTKFSKDDPNTQWKMKMEEDYDPVCPYLYKDGGEGWQMTGHLVLEKRCC